MAALFAGWAAWLAYHGLPAPRGDDAFYKAPGVELAAGRGFAQPSAKGYLPEVEKAFVAYPPLYPLAFGAWCQAAGFSWRTAAAFVHALHLAGVAALVWGTAGLLRDLPLGLASRTAALAALGIAHFGNLRFLDRQEELAFLFLWLEMGCYQRGWLAGRRGAAASGLFVGLAAFVGPWPGMLVGGAVALREVFAALRTRDFRGHLVRLAILASVAALPNLLWFGSWEWRRPGLPRWQFKEHLGRVPPVSAWSEPARFADSVGYVPGLLPTLLLAALLLPRALWAGRKRAMPAMVPAFAAMAALGTLGAAAWRADSYVYLWSAWLLLLPAGTYALAWLMAMAPHTGERRFLAALGLGAACLALRDPVLLAVQPWQFPAADRPDAVFAELQALIPADAVVATTPRHWQAFQNRNPWRQTAIIDWIDERERLTWDWIVLPAGFGDAKFRDRVLAGYELVATRPSVAARLWKCFPDSESDWSFEAHRRLPAAPR